MRSATKHWVFFIFLIVSLAILIALAAWQMTKARRAASGADRDGPPQVRRANT
jgi:cytochrome oxidase assembly protein ShyY1